MAKNNSTTANTQGDKKAGKTYNFFIQVLTIVAVSYTHLTLPTSDLV